MLMAFKLVGDQYTEINRVQKRRQVELLANNIPEDEALLMKNGRYTCLVCKHRPTFDTIAMLTVHRTGQKHARGAYAVIQQKHLDRQEIEKREQLSQMKKGKQHVEHTLGDTPPLLAKAQVATRHILTATAPYSSLSVKSRHREGLEGEGSLFFTRKRSQRETSSASQGGSNSKKVHLHIQEEECGDTDTTVNPLSAEYVFPRSCGVKPSRKKDKKTTSKHGAKTTLQEKSRFVNLRSSGWVSNPDGTWSKDPNVEFDSDEEGPS